MRDLGRLRQSGRAAGEDQRGNRFFFYRLVGHCRRGAIGQKRLELPAVRNSGTVQVEEVGDAAAVRLLQDIGYRLVEVVRIDQDPGLGVGQNGCCFPPVQTPVEGGVAGAELGAGEEGVQMFDPVPGQDCHPVAGADAGLVAQPVRQPVGALVQFAIGKAPRRLFPGIHDRQTIG